MDSRKFMKTLVFGKLILVILAFSIYQGWIQIGDLASFAADEVAKSEDEKDGKKLAANDTPKEKEAEAEKADDPETKERKSFLSDLFKLPKIDPKNARKEEIGKYLDMADRKDKQIKAREEALAKREAELKNIERSIDEKLVKMDEEKKFIAKTLQQEKDLKGERVEKLITLFDKMEPKKAAPQLAKMDKDLVVAMLKGLKQKQVTTILETMDPDKSVEITEYFGRVKSGREYDLLKELNSSLKKEFAECKGMPEEPSESKATADKDKDAKKDSEKKTDKPETAAKPEDTKTKEAH